MSAVFGGRSGEDGTRERVVPLDKLEEETVQWAQEITGKVFDGHSLPEGVV